MKTEYPNAFNEDTYLQKSFAELINKHRPDLIIETGTYRGDTTEYLASFGVPVITIEVNEMYFNSAKERLKALTNVQSFFGDSPKIIESIFASLENKKIVAFLDAHWQNDAALERELELFSNLKNKPVVMIHDFYVPGKDFGFDSHDNHRYDYEFYEPFFIKLYGKENFNYFYNEEATGCRRGVIFLEPK